MAEGATAGGFDTWILVQNPNDRPVYVDIKYQTEGGERQGPQETILPNRRQSFRVNDTVETYDVSTTVTADGAVICERAMYWKSEGAANFVLGHDSVGVTAAWNEWYLAEGASTGGFRDLDPGAESRRQPGGCRAHLPDWGSGGGGAAGDHPEEVQEKFPGERDRADPGRFHSGGGDRSWLRHLRAGGLLQTSGRYFLRVGYQLHRLARPLEEVPSSARWGLRFQRDHASSRLLLPGTSDDPGGAGEGAGSACDCR